MNFGKTKAPVRTKAPVSRPMNAPTAASRANPTMPAKMGKWNLLLMISTIKNNYEKKDEVRIKV